MKVESVLEYKNFVASVKVDGKPSPCYSAFVDKKEKNMSCWIASEESKSFTVNLATSQAKCSLRVELYLDGELAWAKIYKNNSEGGINWTMGTLRTSNTMRRPFIFSPLQTTDNEAYLETSLLTDEQVKNIGEILINVHRVTNVRTICERVPVTTEDSAHEDGPNSKETVPKLHKVHEHSMKASIMPHQIAYGEKEEVERNEDGTVPFRTVECVLKELIASFTFRYRPLEALRTCGLAPQPLPREVTETNPTLEPAPSQDQIASAEHVPEHKEDPNDNHATSLPFLEPSPTPQVGPDGIDNAELPLPEDRSLKLELEPEEVKPKASTDDDDDDDEILKAFQVLQVAILQRRREDKKRKKGEAGGKSRPRKKVKRESEPLVFFAPGETKEVIDLT